MRRLTEAQRNQAIGMLRFESISQVAKFFQCSKSTISRLADRFGQTGTIKNRPRPEQQKKLSIHSLNLKTLLEIFHQKEFKFERKWRENMNKNLIISLKYHLKHGTFNRSTAKSSN